MVQVRGPKVEEQGGVTDFFEKPVDVWLELWLDNDMSTNELHIDQDAADQIFNLIRNLHIDAARKAVARGDVDVANAVADNFEGLLTKFGVK